MIRLRLSKRLIRACAIMLLVIAALVGLYFLGDYLTPRDVNGKPMIFSPTVRNAEMYRRSVAQWAGQMASLDEELAALLDQPDITDPTQLYAAGEKAQSLVSRAANVAREAEFTVPPPAMVGLSEQARAVSLAYLDVSLAAARWVGAPTVEGRQSTLEMLSQARAAREMLLSSRWLAIEGEE